MTDKEKGESRYLFMVHKDQPENPPVKVSRKIFTHVWEPKGWTEFKGDEKKAAEAIAEIEAAQEARQLTETTP